MGLLGKVKTRGGTVYEGSGFEDIQAAIDGFQKKHSPFHCIVLRFSDDQRQVFSDVAEMTAFHGAVCCRLPSKNDLVLLPGTLDMELFSHQISLSTGSAVLFQFTADSSSLALETLKNFIQ